MHQQRVVFNPEARQALSKGFNTLADAMQVTLGPRGRMVAVGQVNPAKPPELLNDGALIARRFLGLPGRFETMGAFLARHIAWRVEEAVGDGTTTAVVIARHILNQANKYIVAGHDVMAIRRGLEKGLAVVLDELQHMAQPLDNPERIASLAASITGSDELGGYIEEIFDIVGPDGAVDVRRNYARTHDRRYIQGVLWNQGWASSYFTTEGGKAVVKDPYILLTNRHLETAEALVPIMEKIRNADDDRGLVVIAPSVQGDALNVLVTNKMRKALPTLAVKAPGLGSEKTEILKDLGALCGGKVFLSEIDDRLEEAELADLGRADEVQAIRSGFTLIGGKGRPAAIRQRAAELRAQLPEAGYGRERDRLVERSGKLLGGMALLEIGGASDLEQEYLRDRAKEAVRVVRLGLHGGIVPGGGVAFLACLPALDRLCLPADEAVALPILRAGLEAPMRALIHNAGFEPNPIMARLHQNGSGCGFDVVREEIRDVAAANIVDPVRVLRAALQTGVSGAMMAITTGVLVHRPRHNREDDVSFNP